LAKDRPLFREETIKGNDKKIIIAEGEKAVVEAEKKIEFTDYKVMLVGGSNQVHLTNFEALKDREVILWPDNDEAGLKAMTEVALTLLEKDITIKLK
jgi:putative DNA primase/helicase